ncbi:conserved hypothetical protein [Candidatus Desulfarcum epimagneticum]|uniref:Uncharacterized protein n=1 Tax=uncultured Desulfobacteraceae bacterium TaxID=218296 RepID=A0A484HE32_9BACT|nr:conserved hypothetical protein [uncultured Desulfobacteraceae bacterium]
MRQDHSEKKTAPRQTRRGAYRQKRRAARASGCHCCGEAAPPFCWRCRCGFSICQVCMDENVWGMSCNGITWECPDCGGQNGFGNQ